MEFVFQGLYLHKYIYISFPYMFSYTKAKNIRLHSKSNFIMLQSVYFLLGLV